jgi:hypothetical protein
MALFLTGRAGAIADSFYIQGRLIWSLVWFRIQAALGIILGVTALVDPQLLIDVIGPKGVAAYIIFNAVGSEWLRKRKDKKDADE